MRSNPANEQMNIFLSEKIFTNQTVLIPANIKNHPVTSSAKQIC
jgi:hypothetical protein